MVKLLLLLCSVMLPDLVTKVKFDQYSTIPLKVGLSIGMSRSAPLNFLRDNGKHAAKSKRTYDSNDKTKSTLFDQNRVRTAEISINI